MLYYNIGDRYRVYKKRGAIKVVNRINDDADFSTFFSESFVAEFQKQLSPLISNAIGLPISIINHTDASLELFSDIALKRSKDDEVFIYFHTIFRNWGASVYAKCKEKNGLYFDPYTDDVSDFDLEFSLVETMTVEEKAKVYAYLLQKGKKDVYDQFLADTDMRYDDWIRFYREEIFFYQVEKYEREQKEKLNSIK